ncbi:MAG: lipid-A-disaccharide synthase, partial [Bacteroides sp.]
KLIAFLRKHVLKVKYISLVNLIVDKLIIQELVADTMTLTHLNQELERLILDKAYRAKMKADYDEMEHILGKVGAPQHAAKQMIEYLNKD